MDLYSWGRNSSGQLGLGTTVNWNTPQKLSKSDWVKVAVGAEHTLAINDIGELYTWGSNFDSQLGLGDGLNRLTPTKVVSSNTWVDIAAGVNTSFALNNNGELFSCGVNNLGQLGDGTNLAKSAFVPSTPSLRFKSISAGSTYALAISSDGKLYGTGSNFNNQLGIPSLGNGFITEFTLINNDNDWNKIFASQYRSMAIKNNGQTYGWGLNDSNPFNIAGAPYSPSSPTLCNFDRPVLDIALLPYIGTTRDYILILYTDTSLQLFGDGGPNLPSSNVGWQKIKCINCGVFLLNNLGEVWAVNDSFGNNFYGEMGNGSNTRVTTPVRIISQNCNDISANIYSNHALALTNPPVTTTTTTTTLPPPSPTSSWTQRGSDLRVNDGIWRKGIGVAINSVGNVIAWNESFISSSSQIGRVYVSDWNGASWVLRVNITPPTNSLRFGNSIALNSIGNTLAAGDSIQNRLYVYSSINAFISPVTIAGETSGDNFGHSVSINNAGNIVAVGAPYNNGVAFNAGHVRVYRNNNGIWSQLGSDIDGKQSGDLSGWSVSLNDAGDVVAIGGLGNGTGTNGQTRIYYWDGTAWTQRGNDIIGEAAGDQSGYSVSLNSTGDTVAIGAIYNDGSGSDAGHVRVYYWNGLNWVQRGSDINGEFQGDYNGFSISLNVDGNVLAIGSPLFGGNEAGSVRVFRWDFTDWVQVSNTITGQATNSFFGSAVRLNDIGDVLVVGAPSVTGNSSTSTASYVGVYALTEIVPTTTTSTTSSPISTPPPSVTTTTVPPPYPFQQGGDCNKKYYQTIQMRRGSSSSFSSSNILLASGEPAYSIDNRILKIGDGVTRWNSLLPVNVGTNVEILGPVTDILGSNGINVSKNGSVFTISTMGLTVSNIEDIAANYAALVHSHIASDITDFSSAVFDEVDGNYAPISHTHTLSDISDFEPAIFDLGSFTDYDWITIDYGLDKRIQTLNLNGTPITITQGSDWFSSSTTSREVLLQINVTVESTINWAIIGSEWYNQPANPLPTGDHIVLLRDMGTYIQGHYIGSKTGSL